jgi:hypothetical protein
MTFSKSARLGASLGLFVLLIGCETYTQTTSGKAYLERYESQIEAAGGGAMDAEVREAADVEPILTFPARVGIARIDGGRLSPMPRAEAEAWSAMAEDLGPGWGEFLPISPLIAALARKPLSKAEREGYGCAPQGPCIEQTVRDIRLAAARQHVDVVLIYETLSRSEQRTNPLAITWLTLIGFYIAPSESIEADGVAQAVLLDVRNGYTYGYASTTVEDAAATLSTMINSSNAAEEVVDKAKLAAALELTKEVGKMALNLRLELAEKRAAQAMGRQTSN